MNPHRGDTEVTIGNEKYTLCYDLNACAIVMEKFGIDSFAKMSEDLDLNNLSMRDLLEILAAGFKRHHPDLTVEDVGGLDWSLDEIAETISEAFQRGLVRQTSTDDDDGEGKGKKGNPTKRGTGKRRS